MRARSSIILVGLLVCGLTACGRSDAEKAADRVCDARSDLSGAVQVVLDDVRPGTSAMPGRAWVGCGRQPTT